MVHVPLPCLITGEPKGNPINYSDISTVGPNEILVMFTNLAISWWYHIAPVCPDFSMAI